MKSLIGTPLFRTALLSSLLLTAACSSGPEPRPEAARPAGPPPPEILQEQFTGDSSQLGGVAERQGQAVVRGERVIVEKRTEPVREDIPTIIQGQRKADLNRMQVKDFVALGLPTPAAQNVVRYRQEHGGRFNSVDELGQVPGLDPNWFNQNRENLGISSQAAGQAAP
jgi:hypothetical protein